MNEILNGLSPALDTEVFSNPLSTWLGAAALAAGTWALLALAVRTVRGRLTRLAARTRAQWDDGVVHALGRTRSTALVVVALWVGASLLSLPPRSEIAIGKITALVALLQIGLWVSAGLTFGLDAYRRRELADDGGAATTVTALGFLARLALWSVLLLVALGNLGVDVTALVAGLGVGGVAVALATQSILGDLFASLSIVLDKPFVLGDFVVVGEQAGNVERIGLKTTRVRSLWGEQLVFSNGDLLSSRLRNFGRMEERRVLFGLGVTYQTPHAALAKIPGIVREAIEAQPDTRFDRSHFSEYGDFALTFESVYYVLSPDYATHMDRKQAILLAIHERFEREGIEFAYPTQTLFVERAKAA